MLLSLYSLMILFVLIISLILVFWVLLLLGLMASQGLPDYQPTLTTSLQIWIGFLILISTLSCISLLFPQIMLLCSLKLACIHSLNIKFFIFKFFGWIIRGVMILCLKPRVFVSSASPFYTFSHLLSSTKTQLIAQRVSILSPLDVDIQNIEMSIMYLESFKISKETKTLDSRNLRAMNNRHSLDIAKSYDMVK